MPSIDLFSFPLKSWSLLSSDAEYQQYIFKNKLDYLTLWLNHTPPAFKSSLNKIKQLYSEVRMDILKANGGLISLEKGQIKNIPTLKCIYKFPDKNLERPVYLASVRLLFENFSFVFKVQSFCNDDWQKREKHIKEWLLSKAPTDQEKNKLLKSWRRDPYSSSVRKGLIKNRSEDEVFDKQFPNHALSRARKHINELEKHLTLSPILNKYPVYKSSSKGMINLM